jgi:multidrug efflux pump subunit AcrA (membrane-fusion protein)
MVKCRIPAEVTVFPGLTAEIIISGGFAENVLVVPTTAVEGTAGTGNVYFLLPDGTTELRPVTLGLTDGINVEIVEGLAEGDVILQFIPGAPAFPEEGFPGEFPEGECKPTPDGGMVCEG